MPDIPSRSKNDLLQRLNDLHIASSLLPDALALAEQVHGEQRRAGGGSYLEEHVYPITADVAKYLASSAPDEAANAVIIAILHDTIEDSTETTANDLAQRFGAVIAKGVETLSKPAERNAPSGEREIADEAGYVNRIAAAPHAVRVIKIFDRLNNLRAVDQRPPDKRQQYLAETRRLYIDLATDVDVALAHRMAALIDKQASMFTS